MANVNTIFEGFTGCLSTFPKCTGGCLRDWWLLKGLGRLRDRGLLKGLGVKGLGLLKGLGCLRDWVCLRDWGCLRDSGCLRDWGA